MRSLVHSDMGLVHLIFSLVATIAGTAVLAMKKGNKRHKQVGYVYVISMVGLNATALMIYQLFDGFGIFHYGAVFSLLTIFGGMWPAIKSTRGWYNRHLSFMYWSVIALYAAFASETFTRIPNSPFFGMVAAASAFIMLLGAIAFVRVRKKWMNLS